MVTPSPTPTPRRARRIEHLALLLVIAGWMVWFFFDSWRVSASIENLMLIAPATALALALIVFLAIRTLARGPTAADAAFTSLATEGRTIAFIALFAAFIAGLNFGLFDIATFVFVAGSLILLGERNRLLAVGYAAAFTAFVVFSIRAMVPYPVETVLL